MNLLRWARALTPLGRWVAVIAPVTIALACWWLIASWQSGRTAKAEARLSRNQTEAAIASGASAVATIGQQIAREAAIDAITTENEHAILAAPGAAAPVGAELDAVARQRLCRRAVYRQHPDCLQHTPSP